MATNAITSLGMTVVFNTTSTVGECQSFSGTRSVEIFPIKSFGSTDNCVEKLAGLIDEGEITFTFYYDGSAAGVYNDLNTDFLARTSATLLITMSDTSTISCTAIISSLDWPGAGAPGEPHSVSITFAISGKATYTDVP